MKRRNRLVHTSINNGFDFLEALTLVFIMLKLCGIIQWSWLMVLSPLWISGLVVALFFLLIVFFIDR